VKTLRVSGNVNRDEIELKLTKVSPSGLTCTFSLTLLIPQRLHREARVWMELTHESIAPLLGVVREDQGPGLVSPWYHRSNLPRFLSRSYHRTVNREILCHDVASGLRYLHTHKPQIIHGDLKGVRPNLPASMAAAV
jgi:serine/threonine protein kinase